MKGRILARILSLFLLCVILDSGNAHGQEVMKVGILPFQVHARDLEKTEDWSARVVRTERTHNPFEPLLSTRALTALR